MLKNRRWFLLGLSSLFLGLLGLTISDPAHAATIATNDFKSVIDNEIKYIKTRLGEPKVEKAFGTLKTTAFVIAHLAQTQMDVKDSDPKQLATLRDAALKIAGALNKKDIAGATKLVSTLTADIEADASVDTKPVKLIGLHDFELHTLMSPFRSEKANGRGYEKAVRDLAKGVKTTAVADATILAYKLDAYADLTAEMAPADAGATKTKANWVKWSSERKKHAGDAVKAMKTGKGGEKAAAASFKKLDASCTSCHNVFRE